MTDPTTTNNSIIWNGFGTTPISADDNTNNNNNTTTTTATLKWYCAPDSWFLEYQKTKNDNDDNKEWDSTIEGYGGKWEISASASSSSSSDTTTNDDNSSNTTKNTTSILVVYPPNKKDYWRRTYYEPLLVKDDAPLLYYELDGSKNQYYTVQTTFALNARYQFDQAGLMVRYDNEHWIKTGIEVVDHIPRLSCVVTNGYSDWSTQRWDHNNNNNNNNNVITVPETTDTPLITSSVHVSCTIRIHCRGLSYVVEVYNPVSNEWDFVRIAYLKPSDDESTTTTTTPPKTTLLQAGVYAACPVQQDGSCSVTFSNFSIRTGSSFDHTAN